MAVILQDDFVGPDGFLNGRTVGGMTWVANDSSPADPSIVGNRLKVASTGGIAATIDIPAGKFSGSATKFTIELEGVDVTYWSEVGLRFSLVPPDDTDDDYTWGFVLGKLYGPSTYTLYTPGGNSTPASSGDGELNAAVDVRFELDLLTGGADLYVDDVLRASATGDPLGALPPAVAMRMGVQSTYDAYIDTLTFGDDAGAPAPPAFWSGLIGTREVR